MIYKILNSDFVTGLYVMSLLLWFITGFGVSILAESIANGSVIQITLSSVWILFMAITLFLFK